MNEEEEPVRPPENDGEEGLRSKEKDKEKMTKMIMDFGEFGSDEPEPIPQETEEKERESEK